MITANVFPAGILEYFITTPMTTVALIIGPKVLIPKTLSNQVHQMNIPSQKVLLNMIHRLKPPSSWSSDVNVSSKSSLDTTVKMCDKKSFSRVEGETQSKFRLNEENLRYISGCNYKICDTNNDLFGSRNEKSFPLWDAEMICAFEFVSLCLDNSFNQTIRKDDSFPGRDRNIHIIGQESRLLPLYQAFYRRLMTPSEKTNYTDFDSEPLIHLTFALPDKLDGMFARHILHFYDHQNLGSENQFSMNESLASKYNRIHPLIHYNSTISEIVTETLCAKIMPTDDKVNSSVKGDSLAQLKPPINGIWLNYVDGKVFNARDLRHSRYWKDLNYLLGVVLNQEESEKRFPTAAPYPNRQGLNHLMISLTINYSNDSEYWKGAAMDWLVQGVHEALITAYDEWREEHPTIEGPAISKSDSMFKIEVLRVARYVVGVPRLFVILKVHQHNHDDDKEDTKEDVSNPPSTIWPILNPPDVAHWQWDTDWKSMKKLLKDREQEMSLKVHPNPRQPSPSTDRFRRVTPLVSGFVKHIVSFRGNINGRWGIKEESDDAFIKVLGSKFCGNQKQGDAFLSDYVNTNIMLYEDGFQYVCPALINLKRSLMTHLDKDKVDQNFYQSKTQKLQDDSNLELSCCSEDPLQLLFLKKFKVAETSKNNDRNSLNVIELPDKDIKHSKRNNNVQRTTALEASKIIKTKDDKQLKDIFENQDCLILLLQGGCKRWKDMFGEYVSNWIFKKDQDYRINLKNLPLLSPPPIAAIAIMVELSQGIDDIMEFIRHEVSKLKWIFHCDEKVNIYNTSRASIIITCILCPNNAFIMEETNPLGEDTKEDTNDRSDDEGFVVQQRQLHEEVVKSWALTRNKLLKSFVVGTK